MLSKDIEIKRLWELYEQGLSSSEIGEKVGLSAGCIRYRLTQAGFKLRSPKESIKLAIAKGRWSHGAKGENNSNWKGGRHLHPQGYWRVYQPNHHRAIGGYVWEHILVWEQANHKELPKDWVIHHLNGIRTDNRPENLVAMPRAGHARREMAEIFRKRIRELEEEVRLLRACQS
jgi:hypothetical protein